MSVFNRKYRGAHYATPVKPEPLKVGDLVVDLRIFQATGKKIIGKVTSLCELTVNGVKRACAVVRGDDRSAPGPSTAWVVCDELTRFRRALDSEVAS